MLYRLFGRGSSRHHEPDGPRLCQFLGKIREICSSNSAFLDQRRYRFLFEIVYCHFMPFAHKTARHICTHSPQTNNTDLHNFPLFAQKVSSRLVIAEFFASDKKAEFRSQNHTGYNSEYEDDHEHRDDLVAATPRVLCSLW